MRRAPSFPSRPAALAAVSGLLLLAAFPPLSLWPLAFVFLVPLLYALEGTSPRKSFWLAGLFAAIFYAGLLHWIVFNPAVERWVRPLLYLGVALIAAYLALYAAAAAAAARWIAARTGWPLWLVLPFCWTMADYLRGLGMMGFPWGSAGYAIVRFLPAIQMSEFVGVPAVTFWVVLVNGLSYAAVRRCRPLARRPARRDVAIVAAGLLLIILPVVFGLLRLEQVRRRCETAATVRVTLVQGNIEQGLRWDAEFQEENWRTYDSLSRDAAKRSPALVVWPETALPFYLRYQERYLTRMRSLVDQTGAAVLTGVPDLAQDFSANTTDYFNSSFLFAPNAGLVGQYAKTHLVPFGERFPLKERIPGLRDVNFGEGEWTPGSDTLPLRLGDMRFANLICFESIFPELARAMVRRGAAFLTVITNDGWFGRSGAARQHADMAVLRAVETRRAVARCANSGVSLFILPDGSVRQPTALYRQAVITADLPLLSGETFYVRHGDLFVLLVALLTAGAAAAAIVRPRT
ncbi:MAG: apolipoprotein N-acyltransferase [Candidatus Edwardsbacteria bacterium]|nr:apolipoprotein N-acyltransferase [Candidatus Edwardsbacteria bacterium]